ncbi:RNA polymerase II C-terminal domain phosphatase-like 3 [Vicia villosa]|uniref:RNA polymerase II C-terminal domain phosphatase-like 3 n=1 Tax=Vicia villosa TaxID=3911 RepID=UPI00273AF796|nr:RNA polymerase II C-terminal domain phosphatase-like 3 [Vicia villosa]
MVFGSFLDCDNLKNLEEMGKEVVEDVEEGEISDTASVEEISEEDFKKQDVVKVNGSNSDKATSGGVGGGGGGKSRVLAVQDLYSKYPTISRGYAAGLYNLAWAQAVQNKPLNDIFVMELDGVSKDTNANSNNSSDNKDDLSTLNEVIVVDDDDKEEGELEEGEIDGDDDDMDCVMLGGDASETIFDSEVIDVRDVLESITVANVAESFAESCTRLQSALQSKMFAGSEKDVLVPLLFNAVKVIYSVFCSMEYLQKEENKDNLLRLLSSLKNEHAHLFTQELNKEIQAMITSIVSVDALGNSQVIDKEGKLEAFNKSQQLLGLQASGLISSSMLVHDSPAYASETLFYGQNNFKGPMLPLFDLHKDHDLDSLPSPTREAPSCFPVNKLFSVGDGMDRFGVPLASKTEPERMELDGKDSKFHIYENDALKAFSTYQQKFNQSSFFTDDKFPSPTPSGDCEEGVVDTNGEVSSASIAASLISSKSSPLDQMPVSSTSTSINRSSTKSRDPRLRFINSDTLDVNQPLGTNNMPKVEYAGSIISRKQKAVEEPSLDASPPKRLRRTLENSQHNTREERTMDGKGGWLEENTLVGSQLIERNHLIQKGETELKRTMSTSSSNLTMTSSGNEQTPITSGSTTASLPALLKNIAVNPTMLLNILLEQQQRLAAEAQTKPVDYATSTLHLINSNSTSGTDATVNTGPTMTAGLPQSSVGMFPTSSPATSMAPVLQVDSGKVRMKPRDPRRFLHGSSTLQKGGSLGSEQSKTTVSPMPNNQATDLTSPSIAQPDITRQFTKNLKNIADIMSVPQEPSTQSPATQNVSSASVPFTSDRAEQKSVLPHPQNLKGGVESAPETCTSGSPQPQNTWADVEHLFEGYDEKQKAAIQRERSRRLEEQNKMFAARKLCLVLDLDHTLLNSAKFMEVDPVHDEILRKKEEQDREKPHRHLFRFPHMGMWTKLRPGVWNFLEKASKLFEMHLYTMGNKLYATEMAKVLDPKGVLFAGRVISRGDDTETVDGDERAPKSKDLEGVLGMESSVVIIDDSVRVWPHNKLNLIVVERYTYFPCSRRQFGLPGPSLLEIDHDERPDTGSLASSLGVIERIHQNFFASQSLEEVDVRNILASEQRKILDGCRIVFSRVFPVGEANPHHHPLWQTAEQFGASCTNQVDDQVTHVVANSLGTDKVNWAICNGKFVVHPSWVEASALLYRRANEQEFLIKPEK